MVLSFGKVSCEQISFDDTNKRLAVIKSFQIFHRGAATELKWRGNVHHFHTDSIWEPASKIILTMFTFSDVMTRLNVECVF